MTPEHIHIICYSPTGGTLTAARAVASRYQGAIVTETDITTPSFSAAETSIPDADLVILGTPVYEATVPRPAVERLRQLSCSSTPAVTLVSYGQIDFGSALIDLEQIAAAMGLIPILSVAAPAEHSLSTEQAPLGRGRPDEHDRHTLAHLIPPASETPVDRQLLPSLLPRGSARVLTRVPRRDLQLCTSCGLCARRCPTAAIDVNTLAIDSSKCLRCFACVKVCPEQARSISYTIPILVRWFFHRYHEKERTPICYLPAGSTLKDLPSWLL